MKKGRLGHVLWTLVSACAPDPLGKPCRVDQECGSGYDCFHDVCMQVCTTDAECRGQRTCVRYHCVETKGPDKEASSGRSSARPEADPRRPGLTIVGRSDAIPPMPDATAAELRAMRREIELLRQEQARLTESVRALERSSGRPTKGSGDPP